MPFISENALEEALVRAVKSPQAAPDFYRLMLESELLVLGTVEGREAATEQFNIDPGSRVSLVTGEKNGQKFLPVFTSMARMQEYVTQESKFLTVNGRALLDLTRGAPVTLNPASEFGREFTPDEVAQLLDGAPQARQPKRVIGEADFPPDLVAALNSVFVKHPEVATAWMIEVTFADRGGLSHPLVGVETSGDMAALVSDIETATNVALPGLVFDVQRVDRARPVGMADALLQGQPFYERGKSPRTLN